MRLVKRRIGEKGEDLPTAFGMTLTASGLRLALKVVFSLLSSHQNCHLREYLTQTHQV